MQHWLVGGRADAVRAVGEPDCDCLSVCPVCCTYVDCTCAGISGVLKYWLMPWLGYHFWMSTFTVVHHTAPHIPFKPAEEWNAAKAQLSGRHDAQA